MQLTARWLKLTMLALLVAWSIGCRGASEGRPAALAMDNGGAASDVSDLPTTQPSPAAAPATQPDLSAELKDIRDRWMTRLGEGHSAAIHSPFAVIVNGPQATADGWMRRTVLPAAERIQRQFMKVQPDKPLTVLLFVDQESYRAACKKHLGDNDPPYFGFFRPWERLLVMDIRTGGGTLVHEMTHALIAFDFPRIPDWFNEGLGSLYEQCHFEQDRIVGRVNWRLPALQKVIKADKLDSLEKLTSREFRTGDVGLNYAQARYLCLYMQEKGLLADFYREFRDKQRKDPTGLNCLKAAFAPRDLADVEKEWRKWVLSLRFPER